MGRSSEMITPTVEKETLHEAEVNANIPDPPLGMDVDQFITACRKAGEKS